MESIKCPTCGAPLIDSGIVISNMEFAILERHYNSKERYEKAISKPVVESLKLTPEELYTYFRNNWNEFIETDLNDKLFREELTSKYHVDFFKVHVEANKIYFHKEDI